MYISVVTTAPQQVPAYLYQGVQIISKVENVQVGKDTYSGLLLSVEGSLAAAQRQADRLFSGLHGAKVHASFKDAQAHLADRVLPFDHARPPATLTPARGVYGAQPLQQNTRTR